MGENYIFQIPTISFRFVRNWRTIMSKQRKCMFASCASVWERVWERKMQGEETAPLILNHSCDYFGVCLKQHCGLSGSVHNSSILQFIVERWMEGEASESLSPWLLIDSECNIFSPLALLSHSHSNGKQHHVVIAPWSMATATWHNHELKTAKPTPWEYKRHLSLSANLMQVN